MTKDEALKLALYFIENSEGGTADLEAHIKEALAQRPWVWLTDEEVDQLAATHLFQNVPPNLIFAAIFAVQAKLKEKNT